MLEWLASAWHDWWMAHRLEVVLMGVPATAVVVFALSLFLQQRKRD